MNQWNQFISVVNNVATWLRTISYLVGGIVLSMCIILISIKLVQWPTVVGSWPVLRGSTLDVLYLAGIIYLVSR